MMETAQISGGTMLVLGIIIAIIIVLVPAFIYIYAGIAAILTDRRRHCINITGG